MSTFDATNWLKFDLRGETIMPVLFTFLVVAFLVYCLDMDR